MLNLIPLLPTVVGPHAEESRGTSQNSTSALSLLVTTPNGSNPGEVFMPHIDSTTGRQTPRSNAWRSAITVIQEAEPPFIPTGAHAMSIVVEFPPGDPGTPPHRHPGPAFGYVLNGEMVFEIEGEPERVVRAGEAFWEPGGDVIHYQDGNNRDDIPVRYTVTMLCEPGKPMLTLVDDDELAERRSRRASHGN